jgi:hypothetical protein
MTGINLFNLKREANMDITRENIGTARTMLLNLKTLVPDPDRWRIGCLKKFLAERFQLEATHQSTDLVDNLIDSLCSS